MISKQVLLGSALIIGGGVVFFALGRENPPSESVQQPTKAAIAKPVVQPLTADVATEERLLAKKQKEREAHAKQMQKQTELLLAEQDKARLTALQKASAEANGKTIVPITSETASKSELIAVPTIQTRPEAIEAAKQAEEAKKAAEAARKLAEEQAKAAKNSKPETPKVNETAKKSEDKKTEKKAETKKVEQKPAAKGNYQVKAGDSWSAIAARYGISVAALTAANGTSAEAILREGKTIVIPSVAKADGKKTDAKKTETKQEKKADTKKTDEKKQGKKQDNKPDNKQDKNSDAKKSDSKKDDKADKKGDGKSRYSVQVAISPDREKIDELVKQYRAAGYQVTTSNTSRGVRVLIGSEKSADAAKSLKSKIAQDSRVKSDGAFVHQAQ